MNKGLRFEQKIAKFLSGRKVPMSGGGYQPGDVELDKFLLECKVRGGKSIRITYDSLAKIKRQAIGEFRSPAFLFAEDADAEPEDVWVAIPLKVFKKLSRGSKD